MNRVSEALRERRTNTTIGWCLTYWDTTYRRHGCFLNDGHDGAHECICGATH